MENKDRENTGAPRGTTERKEAAQPASPGASVPPELDPQSYKALVVSLLDRHRQSHSRSDALTTEPLPAKAPEQNKEIEKEKKATQPPVPSDTLPAEAVRKAETTRTVDIKTASPSDRPPVPVFYTPGRCYQDLLGRLRGGPGARQSPTSRSSNSSPPNPDVNAAMQDPPYPMHELLQGQIKIRPDLDLLSVFYPALFEKPDPMSGRRRGPLRKKAVVVLSLVAILLALFVIFTGLARALAS